jgi:hypothetical protein
MIRCMILLPDAVPFHTSEQVDPGMMLIGYRCRAVLSDESHNYHL